MNAPQQTSTLSQAATHAAPANDFERLLSKDLQAFSTRDLLTGDSLDKVIKLAEVMASGRVTCPKHLQGNVGDCAAIIGQAMRWGMDHNAVGQKTHLVNGVLGYEAQLVIAVLNSSPALSTRLAYRWADGWNGANGKADNSEEHWCEVSAMLRGETKPRALRVTMAQVGTVRNSPNWQTDARQQLAYLAAKRWGRLHAPDVILGVYTPDELQDSANDGGVDMTTGEIRQPTPPARPELPAYDAGAFDKNLPAWTKLVADGKKTAPALLATLSTKATFSDDQKARILSLQPAPATTEPAADRDPGADDDWAGDYEKAEEGAK